MKTPEQRINILIGQLNSLKLKIKSQETDCSSLMTQLKAVKSGVSSLMHELLTNEFNCCFKNKEENKIKEIFKELIK